MCLLGPPTASTFYIPLPCRRGKQQFNQICVFLPLLSVLWAGRVCALHTIEGTTRSRLFSRFRSSLTGLWIFAVCLPEVHYFYFIALFPSYTKDHTSLIPQLFLYKMHSHSRKFFPTPQNQIWKKLPSRCLSISCIRRILRTWWLATVLQFLSQETLE